MDSLQEVLTNLLSNLASRKEIDQYLREFTNVESTKFAVIKVGGGILRDDLDELASSLAFLQRVGLFPIVVHGAGPQLNEALENESIESATIGGLRVTSPEVLHIARKVLHRENLRLVEALEKLNTRARPITTGVFDASPIDPDSLGLVGKIDHVHPEPLEAAIRAKQLPIVACLGETRSGQILNINADVAARALALAMRPYKLIFLTPTGGLLDEHDQVMPAINLVEDYERLMAQPWLQGGMALKLREINELFKELPLNSSVSITKPDQLARELFTHRGSGTLIRRGESIDVHTTFEGIDTDRLQSLIEDSFSRSLRADYFTRRPPTKVYVTKSYSAAAVLTLEQGLPYLDKFAVTAEAQGAGLGASLWNRMRQETPQLFWRARPDNPVCSWYFRQAEGTHRTPDWVVFWYGLGSRDQMTQCIDHALSLEPSLEYEHEYAIPNIATGESVLLAEG
ncbi:MAG: acetylglutamate kinase [Planctomycetota bacterium]|nr:acetylglutamate kinase [Planctomycetota bacterium]